MKKIAFFIVMMMGLSLVQADAQSVNPTKNSVTEEQLLKALKPDGSVQGRASIPDANATSLIRPAGGEWAQSNQGLVKTLGAVAILGMFFGLALFYMKRGKIKIAGGASGKTLTRFNALERANHWMTASSFIILGLSGLNISFGKKILLPLIGENSFSAVSSFFKLCHNYLAFAFMLGVIVMFLLWVKDNIPNGKDIAWFKAGGGLTGKHVEAKRFNGGQKLIFWTVVLGGFALSWTGLLLLFPSGNDITTLMSANIIHAFIGAVMFAIMIAHAYIGSVGMEGAFDAMGSGEVDANWAKEHHSLWAAEVAAKK